MPKYDAFGREIGENTLTGLGGADFSAPVAPPPEQAPPVTATVLPAGMPGGKRRNRTGLGCVMGLVVVAAVIAVPAIALFSFVGPSTTRSRRSPARSTAPWTHRSPGGRRRRPAA